MTCCSKVICNGCEYANYLREMEERLQQTCPFCRRPRATSKEEADRNKMKRIEANDPLALLDMGKIHYEQGKYEISFEYSTKAAELGNVDAHLLLAAFYREGKGVEKDEKKETYHLEQAAIAGNLNARYIYILS
jgi:TPR repeat protein